jgi:peptidyl-tRNA hydrolase, PTH1 family
MNISGPPLVRTWKAYLTTLPADQRSEARLYVVHDELELAQGKMKFKKGGSARGHNGLKSVIQSFGGRDDAFYRIGVGIGRPQSREPNVVADYVLRKRGTEEFENIRMAASEVLRALEER